MAEPWSLAVQYNSGSGRKRAQLKDIDPGQPARGLLRMIEKETKISATRQILKAGFPPKNVIAVAEAAGGLTESTKISELPALTNREQITVEIAKEDV